ncbi:xanthine dehydrogenase family protein molybdopterin-binding subunit [Pyxidicoccus fallax]|uniref:Xanthine dehydrogenase family protein molybdopterin-binding subunit n=1 Tax=Pyxidicoccus fallax TaxID=394095 RepID=A0A848LGQ5_9BACT|nr:molybdopterin cofactor-binding domain-containing protein [Pyxidicoccus fallax]NMO16585.1 xanthine dehydrogenase family protein molybdopterin-binding subunit [Pyxidicoccus fallax]NPC78366.1 xanthine dehydrogenase family protein molybdopterin-binding subunit [Pyxidicoccus fallax]
MKQRLQLISRRSFLEGMNLAVGGLTLGLFSADALANEPSGRMGPKPKTSSEAEERSAPGLNPNAFVHVAPDGTVTIVCHRSEMGQGIRSSLPVLIADELGADMARVRIVQADGHPKYGDQNTDGSNSVRGIYEEMRRAGATARTMLVAAAARRWKVKPEDCEAREHAVFHRGSQRTLGFGELAGEAAKRAVPKPADVKLRPKSELRRVGRELPLLDGPAYVNGTAVFGADIKLPGMLIAMVARPAVMGGRVVKYDATRALAVPGVKRVIQLPEPKPPYTFQTWGGIAVLAENTWAAMKGRAALDITWDDGPNVSYDSRKYRDELVASVRAPGTTVRNVGDVDAALAKAARVVEAEYHVPHLAHAPMEPLVALARVEGDTCEVWAPSQHPQAARSVAAGVLQVPEDKVQVHVTFLGGGFGRKSKADFVAEVVWLAREAGVPVRVQWTREDDLRNDYYHSVSTQRLSAGLDEAGKVIAWRHRTAFPPIGFTFTGANRPAQRDLQQGVTDLALNVPNVRAEACEANAHVRIGWLRSVYNIFHAFAVNSFVDELAQARGVDTREMFLEVLGPPRHVSLQELGVPKLENYGWSLEDHPIDTGRMRRVIERVTTLSRWDERKKDGRALGLAAHRSFLTYVAAVVSVVKDPEGKLRVDEAWVVVDAGTVINPDRVRSQMEGSVIFGMSIALHSEITMKGGAVEQSNFRDYKLVRIGEAPRKIHVDILEGDGRPGGIGEPGVPPIAPAIANAVFALTGTRVRELPLSRTFQALQV